jgi:hypothetical protein
MRKPRRHHRPQQKPQRKPLRLSMLRKTTPAVPRFLAQKSAGRKRAAFSLHPLSAWLRPPLAGCAPEESFHIGICI